jgi:tetratricopeptide (TPR) repeat protein
VIGSAVHSAFCILTSAFLLTGCIPAQQVQTAAPPPSLVAADQALDANLPDNAIADARSYLHAFPNGPDAAHAYYTQGLGWEEKVAIDNAQAQQYLFQAGSCYLLALQHNPPALLEGDIRASLSNVKFLQDNFPDAISEATTAIPLVTSPQTKSLLLVGIGISQQRLGRFADADQTFKKVERLYPNTPAAQQARDHEGQTKFYVQLGTFKTSDQADAAIASLANSGEVISKRVLPTGVAIVDAGSYPSYPDAKRVRDKFIANFPTALIVP